MQINVKIFNQELGILFIKDSIIYFEYDDNFLKNNINISPIKLPLNNQTYINLDNKQYYHHLAGVFADSLPDKFGSKVIANYYMQKYGKTNLNQLQKLLFIGDRGVGALEYYPQEHIDIDTQKILNIKEMYITSKQVAKGNADNKIDNILSFAASGASAGGARAKAMMLFNPKTRQIISDIGQTPPENYEHYLMKFDDFDDFNDNNTSQEWTKLEYIYMRMAQQCGINIPTIDLIKHNNLEHFIIKRFDRKSGKNGCKKYHTHTLAHLMHIDFNIPSHFSYDEALKVVRFVTKDFRDVMQFYQRMVFNVIARNQDDHAKNTSFIMNELGTWRLSPAYDITYANGGGYTQNHQMSIMGKVNDFTQEDLISIATSNDISKDNAIKIIDKTLTIVREFSKIAKECNLRKDLTTLVVRDFRLLK